MKALVTVASGEVVQLLMTDELPEVGHYYFLESATEGTGAQNRAFHALTMEYFKSGMHSYNADSYDNFREQIKKSLGIGFEGFVYIDWDLEHTHYKMYDVKNKEDIPERILKDPDMKDMIRGKLKSWSKYTQKQRKQTIDNLIAEMLQAGVNSKKFQEILKGMKTNG